jgi:hypothetical protein
MRTSKNPKILNYVIKNVLDPVFHLLDMLLAREKEASQYIEEATSIENTQNEKVNSDVGKYSDKEKLLDDTIGNNRSSITDMIRRNLYNPNIAREEGDGGEGEASIETLLIKDKIITDVCYGFVKEGESVLLAGATNYGLAIGQDTNISLEYSFLNPKSAIKFPSYSVNSILKISTDYAFISTHNGIAEYDISKGEYKARTISHGLNANYVKKIIPIKGGGYLAGTSKGISFSPKGVRWVNVDEDFKDKVTCFHVSAKLEEEYTKVFIGTNKGIYYFDSSIFTINEHGNTEFSKVIRLDGVLNVLPSNYINGIAYNEEEDAVYIATDGGITLVKGILDWIENRGIPQYETYNANHGLSSTLCYDIAIMPNKKIVIATANGITLTSDFESFSYITRKISDVESSGLENYMCSKIIRKSASVITVLHPVGLSEGVVL